MDNIRAATEAGRKHRSYGNARASNPYPKSDPCRQAWFSGWDERHRELGSQTGMGYSSLYAAEMLGAKHRSYDNPSSANPYDPSDPCWKAWRKGWLRRDSELNPKGNHD
jgi:hypothetical protein